MKNIILLTVTCWAAIILAQTTNTFPTSGNVGIGTTSPKEKLHVNGSVRGNQLGGSLRVQSAHGYIDVGPKNSGWAHIYTDRPKIIFNKDVYSITNAFSSYNNSLMLKVKGVERMRIQTNGNVGIGTTSPKEKLHVNGSVRGNQLGGSLRVQSAYGYIDVGPKNSDWAHIYTDRPKIIFNKDVYSITNAFSSYNNSLMLKVKGVERMRIQTNGNVGIGTTKPDQKLTVKGKIHAQEVIVDLSVPADYVFEKHYTGTSRLKPSYRMPSLKEVYAYTKKHKHLPGIPSAKELKKDGMQLSEMTNLLLQKIEELTIYTLEQQQQIKSLKEQVEQLSQTLEKIK